jgi:hypothetical protein
LTKKKSERKTIRNKQNEVKKSKQNQKEPNFFFFKGEFFGFFLYIIQHCFVCCPSDSTVLEDAGIKPKTVATLALTASRSNHLARSHPLAKSKTPEIIAFLIFFVQCSNSGPAGLAIQHKLKQPRQSETYFSKV